ncbi:MAG: vWA domain-containing protein [Planctomycetota bacterium]
MIRTLLTTATVLLGTLFVGSSMAADELQAPETAPKIQLAICLDTSGSMDGLINSARQKIWTIVNDLDRATPTPELRIALLTFGNDGHAEANGWVSIDVPFTEDLDLVSEKLFGLTTNGGTELVGRVISQATRELAWDKSENTLRLVFVAGNESADQDTLVPFRKVCADAAAQGILVNSIYCARSGDDTEIPSGWREVASNAGGHYASIDQEGTVVIATPFDEELTRLSSALNVTYVPYGDKGVAGCGNQIAQDANATGLNAAAAAGRCVSKAGSNYDCSSWDLVDALANETVKLAALESDKLPPVMAAMTLEEKQQYIQAKSRTRKALQDQVAVLDTQRSRYIEAELEKQMAAGVESFDLAVRNAVRSQAGAKGFSFPNPAPVPPIQKVEPVAKEMDGC